MRLFCTNFFVASKFELQLDSLLQALESPIAFFFLQRWHTQELIHGFLRVVRLHLLCVVVFVFDVDVAALLCVVVILILEVVAANL